jgi:thiamine-phosphate pyrophosphorylase
MTLAYAGLHVLADDDERWPQDPVSQARSACKGGARVIQLRVKSATDRRALEWAEAIREVTRECGASFVVNDRFDLALACEADAVHLGQNDLPPDRVPEDARRRLAIGFSTHTPEQAEASCSLPLDYVAFGPVFGTTSKESDYGLRGIAALERVAAIVAPRPLVAIGGIDYQNLAAVIRAGAAGAAVISSVANAQDPVAATQQLARQFSLARAEGDER